MVKGCGKRPFNGCITTKGVPHYARAYTGFTGAYHLGFIQAALG